MVETGNSLVNQFVTCKTVFEEKERSRKEERSQIVITTNVVFTL